MTSESNLSGLVKILHFKLSKYLEDVEWDWNLYLSLARLGSSSLPMSPHHSLCFLQNIRYLNTGSQLRFELHPRVQILFLVWWVGIIRCWKLLSSLVSNKSNLCTLESLSNLSCEVWVSQNTSRPSHRALAVIATCRASTEIIFKIVVW